MISLIAASLLSQTPAITVARVQTFEPIKSVAVVGAPSSPMFAVAEESGKVRIMNAATQKTVHQLVGHPQACYGLAFTPNGQQLVTGDETARLFVWDVKTGKKLREFPRGTMSHGRGIQAISFSKDGKTMVSTGKDDVVILWDYATAKPKQRIPGYGVVFAGATYMGSGMVIGTLTQGVHFRKPVSMEVDVKRDPTNGQGINDLAISSLGTRFVTAGRDNAVGVWDPAKKSLIRNLKGHTDWVQKVAIAPNGRVAASSANDRMVLVWNLVSMQQIGALAQQSAIGAPIAFTGDGKFLISATVNDGLQINSVNPPQPSVTPKAPVRRRR